MKGSYSTVWNASDRIATNMATICAVPSAASGGFADNPHVDMLGLRYTCVNLGAGKSPGSTKREHLY